MAFAIALAAIQKVVNTITIFKQKGGAIEMKKVLKKRLFMRENKVLLCAGIAPMATYEADCWSGACYSSGCYSMC